LSQQWIGPPSFSQFPEGAPRHRYENKKIVGFHDAGSK